MSFRLAGTEQHRRPRSSSDLELSFRLGDDIGAAFLAVRLLTMRTGHVYALFDVREPAVYRYVGKTVEGVSRRLWRHRRTAVSMPHLHVARWITKVGAHNVRIESLGEYPVDELPLRECQWMVTLREAGYQLTNTAPGGQASGFAKGYYRHSPETIARMVATRRARNPNYGAPWAGKSRSAEDRQAISDGLRRHHSTKQRGESP